MDGVTHRISKVGRMRQLWPVAAIVLLAGLITSCGGDSGDAITTTTAAEEFADSTGVPSTSTSQVVGTESTTAESSELTPLRYSFDWAPDSDWAPVLWADELGYFEDAGIDVEYVAGDPQLIQLLSANEIDMAQVPGPQAVLAFSEGIPITVVAVQLPDSPLVLLADADKGITEPADVEGHTVAVQVGEFEGFVWEAWAEAVGVDRAEVNEVPAGGAADVLFVDHQVDVFMDWYTSGAMPELTEGREGEETLFLIRDALPMVGQSQAVHQEFLTAHPEAVAGFLDAWARGLVYALEHPDETKQLVLESYPELDPTGVDWSFARFSEFWRGDQFSSDGILTFTPEMWDATKEILVDAELMDDIDISGLYTDQYLPSPAVMLP